MTAGPASNIHHRMVAILRDLDAIGKDQKNTQQNFQYRGIDQVYNAINPLLAKHGVFMTAEVLSKTREERASKTGGILAFTCLRMRYHFRAEDGSSIATEAEGEGMDSGDKSSNKGMAVAHKYAILQAFCVPTKDLDDPDAHSHEVAAKPSQREAIHGSSTLKPTTEGPSKLAVTPSSWLWDMTSLVPKMNREELDDFLNTQAARLIRVKALEPEAHGRLMEAVQTRQTELF